jgi:uncharacterized membrane protein YkoI
MAAPKISVMLLFGAMLMSLASPVHSADDLDGDRARDLYAHGDIRGLADVLRRARQMAPGDVVGIDLVQRSEAWFYRLDIVTPDGHRRTVDVRADDGDDKDGAESPP